MAALIARKTEEEIEINRRKQAREEMVALRDRKT